MGQDDALRGARGTRRKDQAGAVLTIDRRQARCPLAPMRGVVDFAAGQERRKAFTHRIVEVAQALDVVDDDPLECWAIATDLKNLVELLLVADEQDSAATVAEQPLQGFGGFDRVKSCGDAAGA